MNPLPTRLPAIAALVFVALGIACSLGCSAKKSDPAKKSAPEQYVQSQVTAVQKAKGFKAAYDNPKMDECPVCGKPVNYQSFVSIGHKKYALCSDECADALQSDPGRYLPDVQPR